MSRFHPERDVEPILAAAQHWKDIALLGDGSVFTIRPLWTDVNLEAFQQFFVDNLDEGEGNFLEKLEGQLGPTDQEVKQLAAEMMWLMLLSPSNISPDSKRSTITTIWEWSGEGLPASTYLNDEVLTGIGSAGTAFNTQRWRELVFFVMFLRGFRALPIDERHALLADDWKFAEWIESIQGAGVRQLRHMLLYLLFPDSFERIFGRNNRRKLLVSFTQMPESQIASMSALEMSRAIQNVRREQEEKYPGQKLDFYVAPLAEVWWDNASGRKVSRQPNDHLERMTDGVTREHVLRALEEIDRESYPAAAKSSTYDLIYGGMRFPPKYVLSLAVKQLTGEELPRSTFSGGEESRAFKILRDLDFAIERKDFVSELVNKFLEQVKEGGQTTRDYPKRYRDLDVKVSFGQGLLTHVPWISYTGYGQSTSDGIYPVILFYKSVGVLVVAYGVSETNTPQAKWELSEGAASVLDYFEAQYGRKPERYGASLVHAAFDLTEAVDIVAIQKALDQVVGIYHAQFADDEPAQSSLEALIQPYAIEDAISDLFIDEDVFVETLELLREKKNLILQGAPGVGKTYASKRLAYSLMEEKALDRLGMVQFHQSYSYEDFVQGYRPSGQGFRLRNGVFYDFCDRARNDPGNDYVFIIDELNRGNLSKIFGELLLLIESDKRGPEWAIPLAYGEEDSPKFYVPENLYLIGLMNTADRSLAMVDYALRRRFAFATLKPGFETDQFLEYMVDHGASKELIDRIVVGMSEINREIAADTANLGPGFCIGHSFFCSILEGVVPDVGWFERIVNSEIKPLLEEYYFDASDKADSLTKKLLS